MIDAGNTKIVLMPGDADDSTAADIERCLRMLYSTHPGEQALDRDFGIDSEPVGLPAPSARALMVAEFVAKTAKYEPRARVLRVEWETGDAVQGELIPKVVVEIVENT